MAAAKQRIEQQPAWVLHTYPWRENQPDRRDLRARAWPRRPGRKGRAPPALAAARRAARLPAAVDGLVWRWRGQDPGACRMAGAAAAARARAVCGCTSTNCWCCLTARGSHRLFDAYAEAVRALGRGADDAPILRCFELALLQELATRPDSRRWRQRRAGARTEYAAFI